MQRLRDAKSGTTPIRQMKLYRPSRLIISGRACAPSSFNSPAVADSFSRSDSSFLYIKLPVDLSLVKQAMELNIL